MKAVSGAPQSPIAFLAVASVFAINMDRLETSRWIAGDVVNSHTVRRSGPRRARPRVA
jgi:hypothetical protein